MQKIRNEIALNMKIQQNVGQITSALFCFPPDFIGFKGHFPGRSILPGACQIQCLMAMLEKISGKALALKEIVLAKYISPISPEEEITFTLPDLFSFTDGEAIVRASVLKGEEKMAELKVRVYCAETV